MTHSTAAATEAKAVAVGSVVPVVDSAGSVVGAEGSVDSVAVAEGWGGLAVEMDRRNPPFPRNCSSTF